MTFEEWGKEQEKKKKYKSFAEWGYDKDNVPEEQRIKYETTEDIAPVKENSFISDFWESTEGMRNKVSTVLKKDSVEEVAPTKRSWFQKGAFEDGSDGFFDFLGDLGKTVVGTIADVNENINTAVVDATENLIDTAAYGVGLVGGLFSDDFEDDVGNFIAKEILKPEATGELLSQYTTPMGWANLIVNGGNTEGNSVLGDKADGLVQSGAHLVGSYALQMVGVPAWLTMGVNSFGSEIESALQNDATYGEAGVSGAISAVAEIVFEKLSSAINIGGGGTLYDGVQKWLKNKISSKIGRTVANYATGMVGEGVEEVLTESVSAVGRKFTYMDDKEWNEIISSEDLFDAFIGGAVMSGIGNAKSSVKSIATGRDTVTNLTANEEAVVDKVYKDRTDGKELTKRQKDKIYDEVVEDMKKGRIDIDTIEGVLGGEEYKTYKAYTESEDSLRKELEELRNMRSGDMTDIQAERLAKLKGMNLSDNTKRNSMRAELSKKMQGLLGKDYLLHESYNEAIRAREDFSYDESTIAKAKYKDAAKQTYESIIKYNETHDEKDRINNTNRVHDMVDMLARYSGETGVVYEFKDGKQIKEEFIERQTKAIAELEQIENRTVEENDQLAEMKKLLEQVKSGEVIVNGNTEGGNIVINLDSEKPLNRVLGHEITHNLEKSKGYKVLYDAVSKYAKSKGVDVEALVKAKEAEYGGVKNSNAEREVIADLVGDYIFTDEGFIKNLSAENKNVFMRIYDRIKYFCKIATAGSKEKRDFERLKKAFEDAYKETYGGDLSKVDTKAEMDADTESGSVKHSLSKSEESFFDSFTIDELMSIDDWFEKNQFSSEDISIEDISEELNTEPEKIEILIRRKGLGDSYIDENKTAVMTQERIDREIQDSGARFHPDYAQKYITRISTKDFIDLTVSQKNIDRKNFDAYVEGDSGSTMGNFNYENALKDSKQTPYLVIDKTTGRIIGHNGRHRIRALEMSGIESVEINVRLCDEDGRIIKYNSETIQDMAISSQFDTAIETHISNVIPLNETHREEIGRAYGEKAHANAGVKYSLSASDKTYLDAVERGDNETAQKMVDDAAEKWSGGKRLYTTDEYTGEVLYEFYRSYDGGRTVWNGHGNNQSKGVFLTSNKYIANAFDSVLGLRQSTGGQHITVYAKAENPFVIDAMGRIYTNIPVDEYNSPEWLLDKASLYSEWSDDKNDYISFWSVDIDRLYPAAFDQGYDAVIVENVKEGVGGGVATDVVLKDGGSQMKSADPVTYDDSGNVIPLSERFNTKNEDIRFSLSKSVETTKDLVALHNLTADKLKKSLELGGLPMPSLAITKADIPHSNFGDITLVFGKETIDPKASKKNKVYSADAWTPIFPNVEYEADSKVVNQVSSKLRDLGGRINDEFQRDLSRIGYSIEDYLNRQGGEEGLIKYVMDNYGLKAAYLEDIGKHIEPVTKQVEVPRNFNPAMADKYTQVMDILGVSTAEEVWAVDMKEARDNYGTELEEVFPGITQSGLRMGKVLGSVASYLNGKDVAPEYKTVTDSGATRAAVDAAIDSEGFETWTRNLFAGVEKDSGIYNNKDLFTPSGNRRSFKQTHLPVTLENIVKAMASQNNGNSKNVSGFNGIKTLRAATAETFKSIDAMHDRKDRLQNLTQEQLDEITDTLQNRLANIIESIDSENAQKGDRNPYIRYDQIGEVLSEIGEGGKYNVTDIQSVFNEYGRTVSDDVALEVKQLLYDVTQMPVNIFEAKPERVVSFDEAKVFVVPNNVDTKLKQELLNRGYSIAEYDPNVEGDRTRVVNNFEEYKFSLSNANETYAPVGNYDFYGKDFKKQSAEDIAPVQETATEVDDIAPGFTDGDSIEAQLYYAGEKTKSIEAEIDNLMRDMDEGRITEEEFTERLHDASERHNVANTEYQRILDEVTKADSERFDSLDESAIPPEMEAPYQEGNIEVGDPFADRDIYAIGDRKVKAYMYENPEVKPFFQEEAQNMLGELKNSIKGERISNYTDGGERLFFGTKRITSEDIAYLLDTFKYTYADIEKGLNAIIEDNGKENNAISKRIEFLLDERLRLGYEDGTNGYKLPPNQEYINLLKEKQVTEYNDEAFERYVKSLGDNLPPEAMVDFAPVREDVAETVADEAPFPDEIVPMTEEEANAIQSDKVKNDSKLITRSQLQEQIVGDIKTKFEEKGYDFDDVLKKAKNLSTLSTVDNTPQRVMEKALGYKEGQILSDITVNKVAQNETEGIKWLNSYTDRKNGLLAQISKQYGIKPESKESAAAQMYAEGFFVDDNNEIIAYGDNELAQDFPDASVRNRIKGLANDERIRKIYDETLAMINESRTRNGYPAIQRLDNYFLHFRAMEDTFSRIGLPFNPNDIRAKDLPTDLNGVTADNKPGQPYFASANHRKGKRTSFDLLGGLERYLTSAKNQIYHIDDIQTLRALRNYIAETYGQASGLENIDTMSDEEVQERIEQVYGSHLSTFAKFLNEEANVLAGKTALIDRGLEGILGRRGMTFFDTVNKQVGSNMVGFNISSSLTNFLPVAQTFAKTNKFDFTKAFAQTVSNKFASIFGKGDNFAENSPVVIRRKGADRFYRTPFQKVGDAGYVFMSAVDDISTELIARTKYNELTRKGMDEQQAHFETDKWVSRLMGDRSLGQMPQLYNSKALGLITKFQLEVRNQLDSQFYDTIQEAKLSNEDIENALARNAKTAAKVTSTFVQLAVAQHLFGQAFEAVAGYNPAFDIISVLATMFGFDDDEDSEDTALDNIEQGFLELLEDLPYTSTFTGGRIPISNALPVSELIQGKDSYGNDKSRVETLMEVAPYYLLPGGYGQIKKTAQGLSMFSDDHPVAGSYTDSGNLRFPVEDTPLNRLQAGIFGQYANENAREYFDNDYAPLKEKQIQEYIDVEMPIKDYWEYREGLAKQKTLEDKFDYIADLDLHVAKKNILINNIVDRKEEVDMEGYEDFSSLEEFDFATKYPEKYSFSKAVGGYSAYATYSDELRDIHADKDASGKSITGSRKQKVLNYINNLDADFGTKILLFKMEYPSDNTYNKEIVEYLSNHGDLTYDEIVSILTDLDMRVTADGTVYWD